MQKCSDNTAIISNPLLYLTDTTSQFTSLFLTWLTCGTPSDWTTQDLPPLAVLCLHLKGSAPTHQPTPPLSLPSTLSLQQPHSYSTIRAWWWLYFFLIPDIDKHVSDERSKQSRRPFYFRNFSILRRLLDCAPEDTWFRTDEFCFYDLVFFEAYVEFCVLWCLIVKWKHSEWHLCQRNTLAHLKGTTYTNIHDLCVCVCVYECMPLTEIQTFTYHLLCN